MEKRQKKAEVIKKKVSSSAADEAKTKRKRKMESTLREEKIKEKKRVRKCKCKCKCPTTSTATTTKYTTSAVEADIALHAETQYTLSARGGRNPQAELEAWNVRFFSGQELKRWYSLFQVCLTTCSFTFFLYTFCVFVCSQLCVLWCLCVFVLLLCV